MNLEFFKYFYVHTFSGRSVVIPHNRPGVHNIVALANIHIILILIMICQWEIILIPYSWILEDEFYLYITRLRGSNQLTNEKIKKNYIFESFSLNNC
jgi:hypothetical protein